jgi:hypothetical protein
VRVQLCVFIFVVSFHVFCSGVLVLSFTIVFIWELGVAGQPRILEPPSFQRIVRKGAIETHPHSCQSIFHILPPVLRIAILAGLAVSLGVFVMFAVLTGQAAYYDPAGEQVRQEARFVLCYLFC